MKKIGFGEDYWQANYSNPEEMDGIGNGVHHVAQLKNLLALDLIDINSIVDLGFGLGHLFEEFLKAFVPYKALGIEPSEFAFKKVQNREIKPVDSMKLQLKNCDLLTWCRDPKQDKRYDLGICTSVLQYIEDSELEEVLQVISQRVKYLYLTVPTNKELDRQREDLEFVDTYAIRRSRSAYLKAIRPHFTIVSSRVLESKVFFNESNTFFTDLLFRF